MFSRCLFIFLLFLFSACTSAEEEVPRLVQELSHSEAKVRSRAAQRLAGYGEDAKPAVDSLIRLLKDKNGGVRSSAAFALRKIGTKKAIRALDHYSK